MEIWVQIASVLIWLLFLKVIQMVVWPLLREPFGDLAYPVSYPVAFLLFTLLTWYLGLAGLPVFAALVLFLLVGAVLVFRKCYVPGELKRQLHWDGLFLLLFAVMLEVRFFNPSISYAEKFMDHTFLASIIRNPVVSPLDPWFASGTLDTYYYIGHWGFGATAATLGVPSQIAFNLVLPTVVAFTGIVLCALGHLLLQRHHWLPVLTLVLVPPVFLVELLSFGSVHDLFWNSTRVIADTITEYPLFSFVWGDPHAHVLALFNQALLLFLLAFAYLRWTGLSERGRWVLVGAMALSLGSMPGINSWDVLVYAPVILLFGVLIWQRVRREGVVDPYPWRVLLVAPAVGVLLYLPYYLMMNSAGIEGIGFVTASSDPVSYLLVFGFFLLVFWASVLPELRKRPLLLLIPVFLFLIGYGAAGLAVLPLVCLILRRRNDVPDLFAILGLLLITFIEFVYLKDNMGETWFRMNTVFKLSLVAWMMMSVAALAMIGRWWEARSGGADVLTGVHQQRQKFAAVLVVVLVLVSLPFVIPDMSYGYGGKTLDGVAWLETMHPSDAAGIAFVRTLPLGSVVLEAEGGDYTYFSRVSSLSGVPSVLGMPFHEIVWRGDAADEVTARMNDVRTMYEDPVRAPALLAQYHVTHLYVGPSERERYAVNLPDGLMPVFEGDGVVVYQVCSA